MRAIELTAQEARYLNSTGRLVRLELTGERLQSQRTPPFGGKGTVLLCKEPFSMSPRHYSELGGAFARNDATARVYYQALPEAAMPVTKWFPASAMYDDMARMAAVVDWCEVTTLAKTHPWRRREWLDVRRPGPMAAYTAGNMTVDQLDDLFHVEWDKNKRGWRLSENNPVVWQIWLERCDVPADAAV